MNFIHRQLKRFDSFQQKHPVLGFPLAVIKKYGDDQAGYQAALLTYYGFLSLFPLLIVLTTLAGLIARSHPHLHAQLLHATSTYIPIIGSGLESSVHGLHKTGLALAISILFTLYGARGVADALRHAVNHVWGTPMSDRSGTLGSILRSLGIVVGGGVGFLLASVLAGLAASGGHSPLFRILAYTINLAVLFGLFTLILKLCLPFKATFKQYWVGAAAAAGGLVILQGVGGYIITHELANLKGTYGSFALVLGLLFWLYLQSQVWLYAMEIAAVRAHKLWPRRLL